MKRKVLFVHHVSVVGGASYCLLNIIKNLNGSNIYPIVLLKNDGPLVNELNKLNVEVHFFSALATVPYNRTMFHYRVLLQFYNVYKAQKQFEHILYEIKPDIVYLNNVMLHPYLKTAKSLGFKTAIHIREHWPLDEHKQQLRILQNNVRLYADSVIAINKYSASMVPSIGHKTTIIYDWIDFSDRYRPFNLEKIFGDEVNSLKIILYTGGMQDIKGVVEVFRGFRENIRGEEYRLLALGVDVNKMISSRTIKNLISSLLGRKNIFSEVRKETLLDSRIKCIPSTYYIKDLIEKSFCTISYFNIPHANLAMAESILLGTVPIAAETNESMEYSNNGEYALLFKMKDYEEFSKILKNLEVRRNEIISKMGKGSQYINSKFSKTTNGQKLLNVLKTI